MSRDAFRSFIAENYGALPPPPPGSKWLPPPLPGAPIPAPVPASAEKDTLPAFLRASNIVPANIVIPELLIDGLLHRGCKFILSGGSKSFKSWTLMDLGMCIAHGQPWWGLNTRKGTVLFLNFELINGFFEQRVVSLCRARNFALPDNFLYWTLRGHCYDLGLLAKVLIARVAQTGPISLIIVDPLYKAYGDLDENSATDMNQLMILVERMATDMGAAIGFGAHFAKGNASAKEAKDRMSGSGVLSRDPDVILSMTRHQVEDAYVIESELRYLPRLSPFVVRWNFPIMQPDEALDPRQLWQPGGQDEAGTAAAGGPNTFNETDVLDCLPHGGAQDTLWRKMVALKFGKSGQEFYTMKGHLLQKGLVVKQGSKYWRVNLNLTPT